MMVAFSSDDPMPGTSSLCFSGLLGDHASLTPESYCVSMCAGVCACVNNETEARGWGHMEARGSHLGQQGEGLIRRTAINQAR